MKISNNKLRLFVQKELVFLIYRDYRMRNFIKRQIYIYKDEFILLKHISSVGKPKRRLQR